VTSGTRTFCSLSALLAHLHSDRDSRSMAVAVHKLIDSKEFDGITFLERRPFYGLTVCLRRPVKSVPFVADADTPSTVEKREDLCSELARDRRTLFAMKRNQVPRFRDEVARCGGPEPTEIGHFSADGNRVALFMAPRSAAAAAGG